MVTPPLEEQYTSGHIVSRSSAPIAVARGVARVHMVPAASDNLSWLLEYVEGSVAVIDGPSLKPILRYCRSNHLRITHLLNTHIHGDHIGINHGLKKAKEDHPSLFTERVEVWGAAKTAEEIPEITVGLAEGDRISLGSLSGSVWLTEGHIDGHISFIFWDANAGDHPSLGDRAALFCGDTMFAGGCGKLFDGPPKKMYESLQRMTTLPADTYVFCAHEYTEENMRFARYAFGESRPIELRLEHCVETRSRGESTVPSTIGLENETNPFVLADSVKEFASLRELKDQGAHKRS